MMTIRYPAIFLLSLLATASAFSINDKATTSRRDWLASTITAPSAAAALLAFGLSPQQALAADTTLFDDVQHGFSIAIPNSWASSKSVQELSDRRQIVVWSDPSNKGTALFIAYTPVRDDFTSLQSFGAVDQVAAQTIMPKADMAGQTGVQAEMLKAESKKQAYLFDYTQAIEGVQPPTHFRTIFTLQQGATGGAGAVLVTITLQTPEEMYNSNYKALFDQIIDSYGKAKGTAWENEIREWKEIKE